MMNHPFAPQLFTRRSFTALVRAILDDESADVSLLEQAPFEAEQSLAMYEKLRVTWQGDHAAGELDWLIKLLPEVGWSQAIDPEMVAPSEVMMVESDLSERIGAAVWDTALAASRRREHRPAWVLYEELAAQNMELALDDDAVALIAQRTAAFHALFWNDATVTTQYPWLPRFNEWVRAHSEFLVQLLSNEEASRYGQGALRFRPALAESLRHFWRAATAEQRDQLRNILEDPDRVLKAILAGPQTIINGDWRMVQMERWKDELIVREWSYVQYGPPMWDICVFLTASPALVEPAYFLDLYFAALAEVVPNFTAADRAALIHSFELIRVFDLIFQPNRWHMLESYTAESAQAWLEDMLDDIERLIV